MKTPSSFNEQVVWLCATEFRSVPLVLVYDIPKLSRAALNHGQVVSNDLKAPLLELCCTRLAPWQLQPQAILSELFYFPLHLLYRS